MIVTSASVSIKSKSVMKSEDTSARVKLERGANERKCAVRTSTCVYRTPVLREEGETVIVPRITKSPSGMLELCLPQWGQRHKYRRS